MNINIKNLGSNQKRILKELCSGKEITVVYDYRIMKGYIVLNDIEEDNTYESITPSLLHSLSSRNLLNETEMNPSLHIQINTFSIKIEVKELLK